MEINSCLLQGCASTTDLLSFLMFPGQVVDLLRFNAKFNDTHSHSFREHALLGLSPWVHHQMTIRPARRPCVTDYPFLLPACRQFS
jgi:hypothetical protein